MRNKDGEPKQAHGGKARNPLTHDCRRLHASAVSSAVRSAMRVPSTWDGVADRAFLHKNSVSTNVLRVPDERRDRCD